MNERKESKFIDMVYDNASVFNTEDKTIINKMLSSKELLLLFDSSHNT